MLQVKANRPQPCARLPKVGSIPGRVVWPRKVRFESYRRAGRCCCTGAPVEEAAVRELSGEEEQHWCSNREALQGLGFSEEEAEKLLRRAFGWTTQVWWRDSKVCEVPEPGQVEAVLEFLESIGVRGADASKVVKKFPEVTACSIEERLKENMAKLERDWKIKGPTAANVIKRQPQVLGYVIDCQGNCEGQCNRCWVRL